MLLLILAFILIQLEKSWKMSPYSLQSESQFKELFHFPQSITINYKMSQEHKDYGMEGEEKEKEQDFHHLPYYY